MKFDTKRYVAPGVPRISMAFAQRVKMNLERDHETTEDTEYLDQDMNNLFPQFGRRNLIVVRGYLNYPWKDEEQVDNYARREFMIQASMAHEALVYAAERSTNLSDKTGLPILTPETSQGSYLDYLQRATNGARSDSEIIVEDVARTNEMYISALRAIWDHRGQRIRPDLTITNPRGKVQFLIDSGRLGIGEGLGILVAQNEIYRLEDQLG